MRPSQILYSLVLTFCTLARMSSASGAPRLATATTHDFSELLEDGIYPIDLRSISDYNLSDYLIISDIEGNLHNVDRNTGDIHWSLSLNESLIRIETNDTNVMDDSNILWFVEPYNDGSLYYFTPEFGLNKLPASIKELVLQSPFSLPGDDKIYTGTRKTSLYTINVHTGEIINKFGHDIETLAPDTSLKYKDSDHLMIGKTTYELKIHSKANSNIVWYVTYSQWGPNNIDNDLILQNKKSLDELYFTPFHDKSLLAINKDLGTPIWITKLPLLAVNVFDIFNKLELASNYIILPHPLKVLNDLQINRDDGTINNDLCFINKTSTSDQWFAMSFTNYPTLIKSAPISEYQLNLFKLENGQYELDKINHLRTFKVDDNLNDVIINGIHKFHHLNANTMYQPTSKFDYPLDRIAIGDGLHYSSDELVLHETTTNLPIPNIIEGIRFPSQEPPVTRSHNELLPTSPKEQEYLLIESTDKSEYLPSKYYKEEDFVPRTTQLSLIRRICEDLIIILILSVLLLAISRATSTFHFFKKLLSSWDININVTFDGKKTEEQVTNLIKGGKLVPIQDDSEDEKLALSEGESDTSPQSLDDTSSESSSSKKINFIEDKIEEEDGKKKRKRGSRGGKRGKNKKQESVSVSPEVSETTIIDESRDISTTSLVKTQPVAKDTIMQKLQIENNLVLSDKILGYGSHGTVVYKGTFENRPVAVKRMLMDFYDVANHEVSLLQQSDDHPNVIRYFCSQTSNTERFLYIALELCQGSLEDLIEKKTIPLGYPHIKKSNYHHLLYQLANGLNFLHNLKIVHRDLKPQNILIGLVKSDARGSKTEDLRLLISDFGLCKKLDTDQSSFRATSQNAASGTSGWRAPELLLNHDIDEVSPDTVSSISSNGTGSTGKRLTRAIDIFSLGCIFYYVLSEGAHPYGDRYMREGNIIRGVYNTSALNLFEDRYEMKDLVESMIHSKPSKRPSTSAILSHPFFWSKSKKLEFLLRASDRFEIERRDPPTDLLLQLDKISRSITHGNWHKKFDNEFMNNLGKYRKYQPDKVVDLLRALRNKYHHFNDMPPSLQKRMSPIPNGFYDYFNSKFPSLLMGIYVIVQKNLKDEHIFHEFY